MISVSIIAGPTASGKSAYAMDVAREKNGTIICGDSLQIYRALPLLTAQPSARDQQEIPHTLYNSLNPTQQAHLGWWLTEVSREIHDVASKGRHPIVVGGTGLYLRSLDQGIANIPHVPPTHRHHVQQLCEEKGLGEIYHQLGKLDPVSAKKIHPHDNQRVLRAYEIATYTQYPLSHWQKKNDRSCVKDFETHWTLILPPKDCLHKKARERLFTMLEQGVLEEVQDLLKIGDALSPTLEKAIGFKPFAQHLRGDLSQMEALDAAVQQTISYIKRQLTWFRNQTPNNATRLTNIVL